MDVVKKKPQNKIFQNKYQLAGFVTVLFVALFLWSWKKSALVSVSRNEILIERVDQGDLDVITKGFGILSSNKQQLLTTLTQASVKEIVLKPGAYVKPDSIIARLENPELVQEVESARQELVQSRANLRQIKLNNQREILNETANLAEMTALYESAMLTRQAEEELVEEGIVSQLSYQESVLEEKQLAKRIDLLQQRIEQLKLVHRESINVQQERIKQQQGQLNIRQARVDALEVKAGISGVLQRLSIELGQSLAAGQEIALIGSVTDLIALIRVPHGQVQQVVVGQSAVIDTRRDKIEGVVTRIDPIVQDNTVEVEIKLPEDLPASARPQLNVDADIIADKLNNIVYIKRPANVKPFSEISLYRLDAETSTANLRTLKLGRQAGRYIEIVSGAEADDVFIISDLPNLKSTVTKINIKS
ncbi:efflux RND transporter periplasmic adaptor subunit [Marinibactrum halimedae]|uniref:RND transporter n=1 Tax=Marinibactrum halimedae TaxID=1444977 RepID=A0AA37T862_9GAMM|nr:HlyD family efflux transporter periplasmic adaptor subunit [Marinibactrum halimedae]MCD9458495.1 HlyD family efflux transporter periplasmic adaptor subunit [Marinibactrum halimedae]GLS26642.1 RND transporter [Marinibactrum halimedae]